MPIYEFRCDACGERFERLVDAGTRTQPCPACGAERTTRVLSSPSAPPRLVRTPREARKQERKNAKLHQAAKTSFSESRRRAREARRQGGGDSGD